MYLHRQQGRESGRGRGLTARGENGKISYEQFTLPLPLPVVGSRLKGMVIPMKKLRLGGLCLALCALMTLSANASGTVLKIEPPQTMPRTGETFTVTLSFPEPVELTALQLTLSYDAAAMTPCGVRYGAALSDALTASDTSCAGQVSVAVAAAQPVRCGSEFLTFSFVARQDITAWDFSLEDILLASADGELSCVVTGGKSENEADNTLPTHVETPFSDVNDHWSAVYVRQAAAKGLLSGYPDGTFRPDAPLTRAEFAAVLWRTAGSPEPRSNESFADVPQSAYYAQAVAWLKENDCISGVSATRFAPDNILQRQEAMKMLFACDSSESGEEVQFTALYDDYFPDSGSIAPWAKSAMYWGYYNELISGTGGDCLSPQLPITRGQLAKIMINYLERAGKPA